MSLAILGFVLPCLFWWLIDVLFVLEYTVYTFHIVPFHSFSAFASVKSILKYFSWQCDFGEEIILLMLETWVIFNLLALQICCEAHPFWVILCSSSACALVTLMKTPRVESGWGQSFIRPWGELLNCFPKILNQFLILPISLYLHQHWYYVKCILNRINYTN